MAIADQASSFRVSGFSGSLLPPIATPERIGSSSEIILGSVHPGFARLT